MKKKGAGDYTEWRRTHLFKGERTSTLSPKRRGEPETASSDGFRGRLMAIGLTMTKGGGCPLCGKMCTLEEMHADHVTSWCKGGQTTPENGQMLSHDCNWTKGKK